MLLSTLKKKLDSENFAAEIVVGKSELSVKPNLEENKRFCNIKPYVNDDDKFRLRVRRIDYVKALEKELPAISFDNKGEFQTRNYNRYDCYVNYNTLVKCIRIIVNQDIEKRLDNR